MQERETKELTTPGGRKATVKTYLTGREVDGVLREILKDREAGDKPTLPMLVGLERNNRLIETALVSFEGSSDNIFERVQDLPASEKAFILKEVQELAAGNF
jgi:hypothetical protein